MAQQQTATNIKILSVVWFKVLPPKYGGQKAVAFFNEYLSQQASLVCICSANNGDWQSSYPVHRLLPENKFQFLNPFVWRRIYLLAKNEKATHLLLEFPYHGIAGFICKKLLKIKLVVNTHNIEFLRFKEQKKWWWRLLLYFEGWTLKKADKIFFKTVEDRETAAKYFSLNEQRLSVIPYGTEEQKTIAKKDAQDIIRSRHEITIEEKILLFAGTLDYSPNADAVESMVTKLIPLLDQKDFSYKLVVCGRNKKKAFQYLNKLTNPNLKLIGEVDDIETYLAAADVFLCPVVGGGGVQTKIIDALSHHVNVVCFERKKKGISNAGNKIISVQNEDWKAFADATVKAGIANEATPSLFFETYNWRSIAAKAFANIIAS